MPHLQEITHLRYAGWSTAQVDPSDQGLMVQMKHPEFDPDSATGAGVQTAREMGKAGTRPFQGIACGSCRTAWVLRGRGRDSHTQRGAEACVARKGARKRSSNCAGAVYCITGLALANSPSVGGKAIARPWAGYSSCSSPDAP